MIAFTSARQLSLSWARSLYSISPRPTSWRSILILSFHLRLGLLSGVLPLGFPIKTLYIPLFSPLRAKCPAHLIRLEFITFTVVKWRTYLGDFYLLKNEFASLIILKQFLANHSSLWQIFNDILLEKSGRSVYLITFIFYFRTAWLDKESCSLSFCVLL